MPKSLQESEKIIKPPELAPEDSVTPQEDFHEDEKPTTSEKSIEETGITQSALKNINEEKPIEAAHHMDISEMRHGIQDILKVELAEFYHSLPNSQLKKEFGQKGDEISREIESLIREKKITIITIKQLIEQWLNEVAEKVQSFNDFYIEQEVKDASDALVFALKEYLPEENIQR